jgi:hypothetical protein
VDGSGSDSCPVAELNLRILLGGSVTSLFERWNSDGDSVKRPLERPWRWEDNINMDCEDGRWIELVQ